MVKNKKADARVWIVVLLIIIILLLGVIVFFVLGKNRPLANNQNNPLNNQQDNQTEGMEGKGSYFLCATSYDSLTWTKCDKPVSTLANSPGALFDGTNKFVYFFRREGVFAMISDNSNNWIEKNVTLSGLKKGIKAEDPDVVLLDNGKYRMYYYEYPLGSGNSAERQGNFTIGSAISDDGLNFVVEPGTRTEFEKIMDPDVIKMGNVWRMHASQIYPNRNLGKIVSFVSHDNGMSFQFENFIELEEADTGVSGTIKVPGGYRMYYNVEIEEAPFRNINSAFSTDGENWIKDEGVRVKGAANLAVLKDNEKYWLIYTAKAPQ